MLAIQESSDTNSSATSDSNVAAALVVMEANAESARLAKKIASA
jgi:hypothetical protein